MFVSQKLQRLLITVSIVIVNQGRLMM